MYNKFYLECGTTGEFGNREDNGNKERVRFMRARKNNF